MLSLLVTLIVFLMLGMVVFQTLYVLGYQSFLNVDKQSLASDTDEPQSNSLTASQSESGVGGGDGGGYGVDGDGDVYAPPAAIILCLKGAE
ncbi:hypothetical protein OAG71_04810, partial [bacterium]|nr:hypothetical protein [bacterium]